MSVSEQLTNLDLPYDRTNATPSVAMPPTVNKLTRYITRFMNAPAAVCSWVGVSGEVPFAV